MSSQINPEIQQTEHVSLSTSKISEQDVARYLRTHSDFFAQHPELIETLTIPHETGEAISLVERQVAILRRRNNELDRKLMSLVGVAKDNEKLNRRLHRIAVALIRTLDAKTTLDTIQQSIQREFPSTFVRVQLLEKFRRLDIDDQYFITQDVISTKFYQDAFMNKRRAAVFLNQKQIAQVFSKDPERSKILSAAVIILRNHISYGLLALGSADANRFQSGMGTLFLGSLGELISNKFAALFDT